jgi:class 3 adenylate cyclase
MMGHPSHRQFTVIGDAMNTARRIEDANKTLGTRFLVSEVLLTPRGFLHLYARHIGAALDQPLEGDVSTHARLARQAREPVPATRVGHLGLALRAR